MIASCYPIQQGMLVCTSVPGYELPTPTHNYYETIHSYIAQADLVIYICSNNFKDSQDCLYELAWGFGKSIENQFFFAVNKKELRNKVKLYELTSFHSFRIGDLMKLKEKLDSIFGASAHPSYWATKADEFLKTISSRKPSTNKAAATNSTSSKTAKSSRTTALNKKTEIAHQKKDSETSTHKPTYEKTISNSSLNQEAISPDARDVYNQLVTNANYALSKVQRATKWMILATVYQGRDSLNMYEHGCEPDDFRAAMNCKELDCNGNLERYERHVNKAIEALDALGAFISDDKNQDFIEGLSDELDMEIAMDNSEFWKEVF